LICGQLGAAAVLCSGCAPHASPEQAEVISVIERLGGQVRYGEQQTVVEVALGGTHVSGAELARMSVFPELKTLSLFDSAIGDDDLAQLAGAKTLETLYLGRTRVTDAGIKHLIQLPMLRNLGLSDTSISDQGLKQLASLGNLRTINVHRTQVTVTGGKDLKAALPQLVIHE
jgi:hypothetical protein